MAMTAHPFTIRLVCPSFYDPFTQVFHSWKYKFLTNNIKKNVGYEHFENRNRNTNITNLKKKKIVRIYL